MSESDKGISASDDFGFDLNKSEDVKSEKSPPPKEKEQFQIELKKAQTKKSLEKQ